MSEVYHRPLLQDKELISRTITTLLQESEFQDLACKHKQVAVLRNTPIGVHPLYDQVVANVVRAIRLEGGHVTEFTLHESSEQSVSITIPDGTIVKEAKLKQDIIDCSIIISVNDIQLDRTCGFTGAITNIARIGASQSINAQFSSSNDENTIAIAEYAGAIIRNHQRFHIAVCDTITSDTNFTFESFGIFASYDMVSLDELISTHFNKIALDETYIHEDAKKVLAKYKEAGNELLAFHDRPWDTIRKLAPISHWQAILNRADAMNLGSRLFTHIKDGVLQE